MPASAVLLPGGTVPVTGTDLAEGGAETECLQGHQRYRGLILSTSHSACLPSNAFPEKTETCLAHTSLEILSTR